MAPLPTIYILTSDSTTTSNKSFLLPVESFTPETFSSFGTAIVSPFPSSLSKPVSHVPYPLYAAQQPVAVQANQGSALKTAPISPLTNNYPQTSNSSPLVSMFSCFPRLNLHTDFDGNTMFKVGILERHPCTTQTFCPLAAPPNARYLVIVAPSLSGTDQQTGVVNPPDLSKLRAFIANRNQAVTYGVGTWHAPMVVLPGSPDEDDGEDVARVDFVVTQFVDGTQRDCEEVLVGGDVQVVIPKTRDGGLWSMANSRKLKRPSKL